MKLIIGGQVTTSQRIETHNTEVMREQSSTSVKSAEVVAQTSEGARTANHFVVARLILQFN